VIDEAYAEFCDRPSHVPLIERHEHLVVLRTLSKAWAAAGLRCGSVIAPYPLPSPVVSLAMAMLEEEALDKQRDMLRQVRRNKGILLGLVEGRSFVKAVYPGEANFVLIRVDDADGLLTHCAQRSVILRGFPSEPVLSDCIRISVGSKDDLEKLESALDDWENRT